VHFNIILKEVFAKLNFLASLRYSVISEIILMLKKHFILLHLCCLILC